MTSDDEDELAALRRKAYGPGESAPLSPAEQDRLTLLEHRSLDRGTPPSEVHPTDDPSARDSGDTAGERRTAEEHSVADASQPRSHRRPRGWALGVTAVLVAAVAGFGAGQLLTSVGSQSGGEALPEFSYAQTEEDVILDTGFLQRTEIRAETTRFIARYRGHDIYLAQQHGGGTCIVAAQDGDIERASTGCVSGAGANGGGGLGLGGSLEFVFGDLVPPHASEAVPLSESVTVYTR